LSVLSFGAMGDGVTDDTAALQSAINAAAAINAELRFPSRTYKITGPLHWKPYMRVQGVWGGVGIGAGTQGSRLLWAGAANSVITDAIGVHCLEIAGICIDGGSVAGCTGLLYDSKNNPTSSVNSFHHLTIQNVGGLAYSGAYGYCVDGVGLQVGTALNTRAINTTVAAGIATGSQVVTPAIMTGSNCSRPYAC